ncbi:MAG: thiamine phosphate synthase [bacterium]
MDSTRSHKQNIILSTELYVVTDRLISGYRNQKDIVRAAISGGARMIQLRDKELDVHSLTMLGKALRSIIPRESVLFIINDDVEVALDVDADGVHLGQDDMPVAEAREMLGDDAVIGLSTHSITQAREAHKLDIDYFNVGPVFKTNTKATSIMPVGTQLVKEVSKFATIPFTVMGGINLANIDKTIKSGAERIAVVSAAVAAPDVESACTELVKAIKKSKNSRLEI